MPRGTPNPQPPDELRPVGRLHRVGRLHVWVPAVTDLTSLRFFNVLQLDFVGLLPISCSVLLDYDDMLMIQTLGYLGILVAMMFVGTILQEYVPRYRTAGAKIMDAAFFIIFIIYPSMCSKVLKAGGITERADGSKWLRADLSLDYEGEKHTAFKLFAGVMILVYPLGVPALYFYSTLLPIS